MRDYGKEVEALTIESNEYLQDTLFGELKDSLDALAQANGLWDRLSAVKKAELYELGDDFLKFVQIMPDAWDFGYMSEVLEKKGEDALMELIRHQAFTMD